MCCGNWAGSVSSSQISIQSFSLSNGTSLLDDPFRELVMLEGIEDQVVWDSVVCIHQIHLDNKNLAALGSREFSSESP